MTKNKRLQKAFSILVERGEMECQHSHRGHPFACNDPSRKEYDDLEGWCWSCLAAELAGAKITELEPKP